MKIIIVVIFVDGEDAVRNWKKRKDKLEKKQKKKINYPSHGKVNLRFAAIHNNNNRTKISPLHRTLRGRVNRFIFFSCFTETNLRARELRWNRNFSQQL